MESPYGNFSGHVGLMDNNSPILFSNLYSWSEMYPISQTDDLIIITIEMINVMNNTF